MSVNNNGLRQRGYHIEEENRPPESHSRGNQEKAGSAGGDRPATIGGYSD
jgi:hypothetical protein